MAPKTETAGLATVEGEAQGMAAIEPTPELLQQAYDAIINGTLPPEVGDPAITANLILERIRQGTLEDSMRPTEKLASLREYLDAPTIFLGFHLNPSTYEDKDADEDENGRTKPAVYAVIRVADPASGEEETVQFGGQNVLVQLVKAWEERKFPFVATLQGARTGSGYTTYWLRDPNAAGEPKKRGR